MSPRELGSGWKGLLKAIGWSVAFGVEGLVLGIAAVLGFGALIQGKVDANWFSSPGLLQALALTGSRSPTVGASGCRQMRMSRCLQFMRPRW